MKTFEFTKDGQPVRVQADNLTAAKKAAGIPAGDFPPWRIVPTPRQVARTKSLLRGL